MSTKLTPATRAAIISEIAAHERYALKSIAARYGVSRQLLWKLRDELRSQNVNVAKTSTPDRPIRAILDAQELAISDLRDRSERLEGRCVELDPRVIVALELAASRLSVGNRRFSRETLANAAVFNWLRDRYGDSLGREEGFSS